MLNDKEVSHLLKSSCEMYLENKGTEKVSASGMIFALVIVLNNDKLNFKKTSMTLENFCKWYLENFSQIL